MSHFLASKPCGCWHLRAPTGPLFSSSPALASRHHRGINKSKLASARSPSAFLQLPPKCCKDFLIHAEAKESLKSKNSDVKDRKGTSQLKEHSFKLSNRHSKVLAKFHWVKFDPLDHGFKLTYLLSQEQFWVYSFSYSFLIQPSPGYRH